MDQRTAQLNRFSFVDSAAKDVVCCAAASAAFCAMTSDKNTADTALAVSALFIFGALLLSASILGLIGLLILAGLITLILLSESPNAAPHFFPD